MCRKKGTGLLIIWCEVPEDREEEFNRWYNEEHLAERLSAPGFLSVARYEAVKGGPKHLAVYELDSPAAMESPEYLKLRQNPTEWSKRMSPELIGTIFIRNVCEMIYPSGLSDEIADSPMAPALQIGRLDVSPDLEPEWNRWYNSVYVPNFEKVPGVIRGRRYRTVLGEPKYMTMYELEHENVSQGEDWTYQQTAHPDNARMRGAMQHAVGSRGIWKKTFELD
jgi:hypothetical protein